MAGSTSGGLDIQHIIQPCSAPELPYVMHLLRDIAGNDVGVRKSGSHAALLLEERFMREGWPVGEFVASVDELQNKFDIGRRTCREALGILQARGFIRTRRGRGGGVVIARPTFDDLAHSLALHLTLAQATAGNVLQALRTVRLVAIRKAIDARLSQEDLLRMANDEFNESLARRLVRLLRNPALELLVTLTETVADTMLRRVGPAGSAVEKRSRDPLQQLMQAILSRDIQHASRLLDGESPLDGQYELVAVPAVQAVGSVLETKLAAQMAVRLALEISSDALHEGQRLTSEGALAERFETGVPVVRQAIRILEDMGVVYTQRGGGGGLMRRKSLRSSIIRQLFAYMLGTEISLEHGLDCADGLGREAAALAAQHGEWLTPALQARLLQSLRSDVVLDARRFVALENEIHESLGNPLIAIFVRGLACFNAWRIAKIPHVMPDYLAAIREELDSIASLDAEGACQAQLWKNQLLREQMQS